MAGRHLLVAKMEFIETGEREMQRIFWLHALVL